MHPKHRDALIKKAEAIQQRIERVEQLLADMSAEEAKPDPLCSCAGCVGYEKPPKRYEIYEWFKVWSNLERMRHERSTLYEERVRLGMPELERLWAIPDWDDTIESEHEAWNRFVSPI